MAMFAGHKFFSLLMNKNSDSTYRLQLEHLPASAGVARERREVRTEISSPWRAADCV